MMGAGSSSAHHTTNIVLCPGASRLLARTEPAAGLPRLPVGPTSKSWRYESPDWIELSCMLLPSVGVSQIKLGGEAEFIGATNSGSGWPEQQLLPIMLGLLAVPGKPPKWAMLHAPRAPILTQSVPVQLLPGTL